MGSYEFKKYMPDGIIHLSKLMKSDNYSLFIVGGYPRDIILGQYNIGGDIDICGDCLPEDFIKIIESEQRIKVGTSNFPLGTIKLIIDQKLDVEYTCFRKESYRGDGCHTPHKVVFTDDIYLDALRRDFTVNSLYLDPLTCEIADFFDGQKHIKGKIIKTVRESTEVFSEDALRILRMCRFAAKLGFNIDENTMRGAKACVKLLENISKERIGAELDKILCSTEYLKYGIDAIYTAEINKIICRDTKKATAKKVAAANNDRFVRWAIFLCDNTADYARSYIMNLSLGKNLANEVYRLIANKDIAGYNRDSVIISFAKAGKEAAKRQIDFAAAFSKKSAFYLRDIYDKMNKYGQFLSFDMLAINGRQIMDILNVSGPMIKIYKDKAYQYAVLNPDKNNYNDIKCFLEIAKLNMNLT